MNHNYGYEYVHFSCKSDQICLIYFVALLLGAYIYGYHICFEDLSVYHYVTTLFISDYIACYEIYSILILYIYSALWRRKWQPALVFLPGEFHGQRSPVGYMSQQVRHD